MGWNALRLQFIHMWRRCSGLPWPVRIFYVTELRLVTYRLRSRVFHVDNGRGPGFRVSDFESNRIIAQLQVDGAKTLMGQPLAPVSGAVRSVHMYLNMYVIVCSFHSARSGILFLDLMSEIANRV